MMRALPTMMLATVSLLMLGVAPVAAADDPDDVKSGIIRYLHESRDDTDAREDQALLDEESRRRQLAELTQDYSPGIYFEDQDTPVIRLYPGTDATLVLTAIRSLWASARTVPSQYRAADLAALRAQATQIPLKPGEAFGADYDAESDTFQIVGSVNPAVVAKQLEGLDFSVILGAAGRLSQRGDGAPHSGGSRRIVTG